MVEKRNEDRIGDRARFFALLFSPSPPKSREKEMLKKNVKKGSGSFL